MADQWTAKRKKLAQQIASGLAGWYQLQAAQNLSGLGGEDSARFVLAQVVNAQQRYQVQTSQRPTNWPDSSKLRMDIQLIGTSAGAAGWYGAVEVKWPGSSFAADQVRLALVQDAVRLLSVATQNLNARLLVLGGSKDALHKLFEKTHPNAPASEQKRTMLGTLLPRTVGTTASEKFSDVIATFSDAESRVPQTIRPVCQHRIRTTCLAAADSKLADEIVGHVYVWQCGKTGGNTAAGQ